MAIEAPFLTLDLDFDFMSVKPTSEARDSLLKMKLRELLDYALDSIMRDDCNMLGPKGELFHKRSLPLTMRVDYEQSGLDHRWSITVSDQGEWY